jgi:hypothetical protein
MLIVLALVSAPGIFDRAYKPGCAPVVTPGRGRPDTPGVVLGAPYQAPELRVQLTSEDSGTPLANIDVVVAYVWDYWDCTPSDGEWELAADLVRCRTDTEGRLALAAYTVQPRGWCEQPSRDPRKPAFVRIDVSYGGDGCISEMAIHLEDIERYVATEEAIVLEGGCIGASVPP